MGTERPKELKNRKETEPYSTPEAIVVLGRGVGMNPQGNWVPTPSVTIGRGPFRGHTGEICYSLDPDGKVERTKNPNENMSAVIGGANANVRAAYEIIKVQHREGQQLPLIIFAAGRPKYLENAPEGTSEGSVLRNKLFRLLERDGVELPSFKLQPNNKATIDDICESLKFCAEQGYKNVGIITIEPHVFRSWQMARRVMIENPDITRELQNVFFINSWKVLGEVDPRYHNIFEFVKSTLAYRRTLRLEQAGRRALRNNITNTQQLPRQK